MHMITNEKNTVSVCNTEKEEIIINPNITKRDDKIKKDYVLLRNYDENIRPMRGMQLKSAMMSIRKIEKNELSLATFTDIGKVNAKSMFQANIISGIMMYIEDLVILSESFKSEIPYYKLLDPSDKNQHDVEIMIIKFCDDANSFSNEEFRKIFGYIKDSNLLDLENEEKNLVEQVIQENIVELRRVFIQIKKFAKTHYSVFKRFKHAGAPLIPGTVGTISKDAFISEFESCITISDGKDPLEDIIVIPLSKDVLKAYSIISEAIQICLKDMVKNHINCIEQMLTGVLPVRHYSLETFSAKDEEMYQKTIKKFYDKHPHHIGDLKKISHQPKIEKEKLQWYIDLPNFLKECSKRKETSRSS